MSTMVGDSGGYCNQLYATDVAIQVQLGNSQTTGESPN